MVVKPGQQAFFPDDIVSGFGSTMHKPQKKILKCADSEAIDL